MELSRYFTIESEFTILKFNLETINELNNCNLFFIDHRNQSI
jgi:hypothetical protein